MKPCTPMKERKKEEDERWWGERGTIGNLWNGWSREDNKQNESPTVIFPSYPSHNLPKILAFSPFPLQSSLSFVHLPLFIYCCQLSTLPTLDIHHWIGFILDIISLSWFRFLTFWARIIMVPICKLLENLLCLFLPVVEAYWSLSCHYWSSSFKVKLFLFDWPNSFRAGLYHSPSLLRYFYLESFLFFSSKTISQNKLPLG